MSLVFNGNSTIDNIIFNGNTVEHLIYNGVEVWSKQSIDYTTIPMTFKILSDGTINIQKKGSGTLKSNKYKINNGAEQSIGAGSINVVTGDIITWTLLHTTYGNSTNAYYFSNVGTAQFEVYGNIMLSCPTGTINGSNADNTSYRFYYMFYNNSQLISAKNLILPDTLNNYDCYYMFYNCDGLVEPPALPATTLKTSCYERMFYSCNGLTKAPELPALTLVSNCYNQMFYNCANLNWVKAMFTTTPSTNYTNNWLQGASSTGTFVKNSNATWTQIGYSAVPSGWTIQYATP